MAYITLTKEFARGLKIAYGRCKNEKGVFMYDGNEYYKPYAKYLLEYIRLVMGEKK